MRKLAKILSVILLVVFVVAALGLFVPSFLGIETIIVGNQVDTNISTGTVIYGQHLPVEDFSEGDQIIYTTDTCAYIYEIKSVDVNEGEVEVHDSSNDSDTVIQTRKNLVKKTLAVPLVGYLYIATQSTTGLITLGCLAAAIILFFVFGCLVDVKDEDDDDYDEDEDDGYFSGIATSMQRPHSVDTIPAAPSAADKNKAAAPAKPETPEASGLEVNEDNPGKFDTSPELIIRSADEDVFSDDDELSTAEVSDQLKAAAGVVEESEAPAQTEEPSENQSEEISESSVPQETIVISDDIPPVQDEIKKTLDTSQLPDMEAALEAALSTTQLNRTQAQTTVLPVQQVTEAPEVNEIEIAMPSKTLEEYLQEAYTSGDDPGIVKDETTGIQFVDFSDSFK